MNLPLSAAWNIPSVRYAAMALLVAAALIWIVLDTHNFQQNLINNLQQQPPVAEQTEAQEQPLDISVVAAFLGLQSQANADASQPNLPLTLLACFVESRHELSRALIQSPDTTAFFHLGETLPGGGTLASVGKNEVVVLRNGQRHILTFTAPDKPLLIALPLVDALPANPLPPTPLSTAENPR